MVNVKQPVEVATMIVEFALNPAHIIQTNIAYNDTRFTSGRVPSLLATKNSRTFLDMSI